MSESIQTGKNPVEVHMTLRDWNQSNHSTKVSAEHMIATMQRISDYGIHAAQLAGGTFGQLLIKHDWNPYEYVEKLTDHANKETGPDNRIEITALFRNEVGLSISRQAPDTLEHIIRRHAEIGVNRLDNFHHTNDSRMMRAVPHICHKFQDKGYNIYAQAGITIQSNPDSITNKTEIIDEILFEAEQMIKSGHRGFYAKNASGVLYPDLAFDVVSALKSNFDQPVGFHTHNSYGLGYQTTLAVIEAGADSVDALPHALAEGTGQISIEKLVSLMEKNGMNDRVPEVNLEAIRQDELAAFAVRGQYSGLELKFDPELFEVAEASTSAGGALTSLMAMHGAPLRPVMSGLDDEAILRAVLEQKAKNRKAFGFVTSVTPVEDMQNTQAIGDKYYQKTQGNESFAVLSEPAKRFLIGHLGKVPKGVDPDLQKRALKEAGLEEVVPVVPFEDREPEMGALKQELVTIGIENPTDDEATFMVMNAKDGVDFILRQRAGELNPTIPQLPLILDEGGALDPYKGALFQIAYDLLDLYKIEIGHYEGADYHALREKGRIIDVSDEEIDVVADRHKKIDLSVYAAELEQKIAYNMLTLEQRLQDDGADRSLASGAQKVILRLASDIGVPNDKISRMDLIQFPEAKNKSPMAKKDQTWPEFFAEKSRTSRDKDSGGATNGHEGVTGAWGDAKRVNKQPPELGIVTEDGKIEPRHPHHDEDIEADSGVQESEAGMVIDPPPGPQ